MKRLSVIILLFILIYTHGVLAQDDLCDQYTTDIGVIVNSYTESWTGSKLKELEEELRKNAIGEEVEYLREINLYSGNPTGGDEEGEYNAYYNKVQLFGRETVVLSKENSINLYNMDDKEIVDVAKTLSHEYGHHFTLYYLIDYEHKTFEDWRDTLLLDARNLGDNPNVRGDYSNGHKWSFVEICADDYVQLYGSPTAKEVIEFEDIAQRYESGIIDHSITYNSYTYNVSPQENCEIPLALEIPELKEYWERASGITSYVYPTSKPILALTEVKDLGYEKRQFKLQWSKSVDELGNEAEYYSLVSTDGSDKRNIPVKTVHSGESLEAIVGSIRITKSDEVVFYTDTFTDDKMAFKVYAISSSGGVVSSNELLVDFDNPKITTLPDSSNQFIDTIETIESSDDSPETLDEEYNLLETIIIKLYIILERIANIMN